MNTQTTAQAADDARPQRTFKTADVVVLFARQGVALETMSRALMVSKSQVSATCQRAIYDGELQMMPPESPTDTRTASLAELVNLRVELDKANALIREQAAEQAALGVGFVGVARMTRKEAVMVDTLARRGRVSKDALYNALYGLHHEVDQPEPKIIDVFVCKIRRKLAKHGIKIETIWGLGYSMDPENVAKLRALAGLVDDLPTVESPSLVPAS